tara:strand:- start:74889 stop:75749 length:861 start_codon:yes stop_codon:yes gene_type:complete
VSQINNTPEDILSDLRKIGFRPSKAKGQHFLKDSNIARQIIKAAGITSNTNVLEIGPGTGALTRHLINCAGSITAVEIDPVLAKLLQESYITYDNLTILNSDVLSLNLSEVMNASEDCRFVLVANLPYGITGPVLGQMIKNHGRMERAVVMLQSEVGSRLTATPGTKEYGAITSIIGYYYALESLFHVDSGRFAPRPAVKSVVLRLTPHASPPVNVRDVNLLINLIKAAFQQRRKMLHHAVNRLNPGCASDISEYTGINLNRRGETLDLVEFSALANALWEYKRKN